MNAKVDRLLGVLKARAAARYTDNADWRRNYVVGGLMAALDETADQQALDRVIKTHEKALREEADR